METVLGRNAMILRVLTLWRLWQAYRVITRPRNFQAIARVNFDAYLDGYKKQLTEFREQIAALAEPSIKVSLVPDIVRPLKTLKAVTREVAAAQAERDRQALRSRTSWLRHPIKRFRLLRVT